MNAFMCLRVKQRLLETLMMVHHHRPLPASLFHFIYIFSLVSCPFFVHVRCPISCIVENLCEKVVIILKRDGGIIINKTIKFY